MDGKRFDPTTGEVKGVNEIDTLDPPGMPPAIAAAIIAVKKQVKQLGDDARNPQGGYPFVSVDKFYATIGKLMADAGLALLIDETMTEVRGEARTNREGESRVSPWLFAQYVLSFLHESGAMSAGLRRSIALPISGPQAFGAAQSYIEKQFLRQVFKVPTGERDADDTPTDGIAPESRNAGRTSPGAASAAPAGRGRPQAAPAPSAAKEAATARWKELRDLIDAAVELRDLEGIDGCQAWETCTKMIAEAEGDAGVAANAMRSLSDRLAKRHDMLTGGVVPPAGHDQYGSIDR